MPDEPLDPREMTPDDFLRLGVTRTSRGDAVRAMCLQCMGGSPREVLLCASANCPLWPFRMGTDPWREKREMSDEQRAASIERLAAARAARAA